MHGHNQRLPKIPSLHLQVVVCGWLWWMLEQKEDIYIYIINNNNNENPNILRSVAVHEGHLHCCDFNIQFMCHQGGEIRFWLRFQSSIHDTGKAWQNSSAPVTHSRWRRVSSSDQLSPFLTFTVSEPRPHSQDGGPYYSLSSSPFS